MEDLEGGTTERIYSFDDSAENWIFSGSIPSFSAPLSNTGYSGLLNLTSTTNTNTFGYWASPTTDITLQDYLLYKAQFTVGTDVTAGMQAPLVRFRLYSANNQVARCLIKQAFDQISSEDYVVLFKPASTVAGQGLGVAFDILNFDPSTDPQGRVSLDSVTITSHSAYVP